MTELLFRDDPYLAACEARVLAVREGAVELDRTVFYPQGGGQPGDSGRLAEWRVLDARNLRGLARVPTLAVLHPQPGLLGCAALATERNRAGAGR